MNSRSQQASGSAIEGPVYGLIGDATWSAPSVNANRFGAEFGNRVWQVRVDYPASGARPAVTIYTVYPLRVDSSTGEGWVESGIREAKAIVAGDLLTSAQDVNYTAERPWDLASFPVDDIPYPAERLTTDRGTGWVVTLDTAFVGIVGLKPPLGTVGRVDLTVPSSSR